MPSEQSMSLPSTYLPDCWDDDQRMNLLFVEFRNRNVNPDGWASKMKFWSDAILHWSNCTRTLIFTNDDVNAAFMRKGKSPACMKTVLNELESKKIIIPASEFIKNLEDSSWVSWGFDYLVKKPLAWGVSSIMGALNWTSPQQGSYVCVQTVKEIGDELIKRHEEHVTSEWLDHCVPEEDLWKQCCDLIPDRRSFEIILMHLRKEGKVSITSCDNQDKIIKFRRKDEVKAPVITDIDLGIIKLQSAKQTLESEIDSMHLKSLSLREEAAVALHAENRTKAKMVLAKKQRLEKDIQKKEMSLFNVEGLLTKLRESDSQKKIITAYESGVLALKKTANAIDFGKIDTTMAEMEEAFDMAKEVQDELSRPFQWAESDSAELEAELDRMLLEEREGGKAELQFHKSALEDEEELARLLDQLEMPQGDADDSNALTSKADARRGEPATAPVQL